MTTDEVKALIKAALPDADIEVIDTTGTGDHFSARVASSAFKGLPLIKQHRLVMDAVREAMAGSHAPLHALDVKTKVI